MRFKAQIEPVSIVIIIIIVSLIGGVIYSNGGFDNILNIKQEQLSTGCTSIKNKDNPNLSYTYETTFNQINCSQDECIVSAQINLDKASSLSTVIFRTKDLIYTNTDSEVAFKVNNNEDELVGFTRGTVYGSGTSQFSACLNSGAYNEIVTPNNGKIIFYVSNYYLCTFRNGKWDKAVKLMPGPVSIPLSFVSIPAYVGKETVIGITEYKGSFNFCPGSNYMFCQGGVNNDVKSNSPTIFSTINKDQFPNTDYGKKITGSRTNPVVFQFTPRFSDGSDITDKKAFVLEGDCSCNKPENICVEGTKLCELSCPSGYYYSPQSYCSNYNGYNSNICVSITGGSWQKICTPILSVTYKKCEGSHIVNAVPCKWWGTTTYNCTGNQKCYLGSSGNNLLTTWGTTGIGGCRCASPSNCNLGYIKLKNPNDVTEGYYECKNNAGGCPDWDNTIQNCPQGLIINGTNIDNAKCICNPNNLKNCDKLILPQKCDGTIGIKKCEDNTIFDTVGKEDRKCSLWSNTINCGGTSTCVLANNTCLCENQCTSLQCDGKENFKDCNFYNDDICKRLNDVSESVSAKYGNDYECVNDKIVKKTGCQYNNPDCTGDSDGDNGDFDCTNNVCVAKIGGDYCSCASELNQKKCSSNDINKELTCSSTSISGVCKWIESTCGSNKICNGNSGDTACRCKKSTEDSNYCSDIKASFPKCENNLKVECNLLTDGCYKKETISIPTDKECVNGNYQCKTTGDYCVANSKDRCKVGESNLIQKCILQNTGCYKWVDQARCTGTDACLDGKCVTIGCFFDSLGYTCDSTTIVENVLIEECKNNACVCKNDSNSCALLQKDKTRCNPNSNGEIQICKDYLTVGNTFVNQQTCHRWISSQQCGGDTPICTEE